MNNLIIFGEDWGQHPSSTQHLAKHLHQFHKITWVNSVGMRAPKINSRDIKRCLNKLNSFCKVKKHNNANHSASAPFDVINPVVLPWHNQTWVNAYNKRQIAKALGPRKEGERRIYWITVPTAMSMLEIHPDDKVVYYCGDDFYALDGADKHMIAKWEPRLIKQASIIFAASQTLVSKLPLHKTVLVEHGVDFELFTTFAEPHQAIESEHPTVGFYGSISEWVDIDLLFYLAKQKTHYTIMLVGPIKTDVGKLKDCDNVVFMDAVAHHQLPSFSQHWQALLMPFIKNQQIDACNPLKLREYLAAGQPVVSTDFPATHQYQDVMSIEKSKTDFVDAVTEAVELTTAKRQSLKNKQQKRVARHDWLVRARSVNHYLYSLYAA